jgi:hypothetical protein
MKYFQIKFNERKEQGNENNNRRRRKLVKKELEAVYRLGWCLMMVKSPCPPVSSCHLKTTPT